MNEARCSETKNEKLVKGALEGNPEAKQETDCRGVYSSHNDNTMTTVGPEQARRKDHIALVF
jgi:hypothetical protein